MDSYRMMLRKRGHWKLEEETLDRVVWRSCFKGSNWIGHILCRICLLKYSTDETIEVFGKKRKKI